MAEHRPGPFELLLEIAARARSGAEAAESQLKIQPHWTGVGFSLLGRRHVAPMAEVAEILMQQRVTRLPRVQGWVRGVANLRGRLLPVVSLAEYFGQRASSNRREHRTLVVEAGEIYCGIVVDEVYGLKHFAIEALRATDAGTPAYLQPFTDGMYGAPDGDWAVFSLARLIADQRFLNAAT